MKSKVLSLVTMLFLSLTLIMLDSKKTPAQVEQARFRVTLTGFVVNHETFDNALVLGTIPERNDFDRPVGMDGDTFNPLAASPAPATFIPAVMLLTFSSAQAAADSTTQGRGVVEITYRDGHNYGQGSYTIFLRVDRLKDR